MICRAKSEAEQIMSINTEGFQITGKRGGAEKVCMSARTGGGR